MKIVVGVMGDIMSSMTNRIGNTFFRADIMIRLDIEMGNNIILTYTRLHEYYFVFTIFNILYYDNIMSQHCVWHMQVIDEWRKFEGSDRGTTRFCIYWKIKKIIKNSWMLDSGLSHFVYRIKSVKRGHLVRSGIEVYCRMRIFCIRLGKNVHIKTRKFCIIIHT